MPPFFPSRLEGDRIYGRGACDAKGILAAQVAAAEQLRRDGETRVGLLFVVGEERGSDGAQDGESRGRRIALSLIDGEPTDNRLGLATRGVSACATRSVGPRRAFVVSGARRIGDRQAARCADRPCARSSLPIDPVLGTTHYTVGLIAGGVAPNVVSPAAEAEVMFRTVGDAAKVRAAMSRSSRQWLSSTCWKCRP